MKLTSDKKDAVQVSATWKRKYFEFNPSRRGLFSTEWGIAAGGWPLAIGLWLFECSSLF